MLLGYLGIEVLALLQLCLCHVQNCRCPPPSVVQEGEGGGEEGLCAAHGEPQRGLGRARGVVRLHGRGKVAVI